MFHTKVVEKIKSHFIFKNLFFEYRAVYEIMWGKKYCIAGQTTDDSLAHAHYVPDT